MLTTARGRMRRRTAILVSGAAAITAGSFVVTADASGVNLSGAMEGRIYLLPIASLNAGLAVSLPAGHPAATVTVSSAQVTVVVTCGLPIFTSNGAGGAGSGNSGNSGQNNNQQGQHLAKKLTTWTETVTVGLPGGSFAIGAGDTSWQPGNVWQGSTKLSGLCHGLGGWSEQGAGFSATVTSSDATRPVYVRFHYAEGTPGTWSGTTTMPASAPATPPPTPTPTPTSSGGGGNNNGGGGNNGGGNTTPTPTPAPANPTPTGNPGGGGTTSPTPTGTPGSSGTPGSDGDGGTQPIDFQPGIPGVPGGSNGASGTAPSGSTTAAQGQPAPSSTPTGGVAGVSSGGSGQPSTSPGAKPGPLSTAVTTLNNPVSSVLDAAAPVGRITIPALVVLLGLVVLTVRVRRSRRSD